MAYFERRRALAGGAMTIVPGDGLAGDTVIQLADGLIERDGEPLRWRTAGIYRFEGERVAEAWLVPLDLAAFDAIWHDLT